MIYYRIERGENRPPGVEGDKHWMIYYRIERDEKPYYVIDFKRGDDLL